MFDNAKKNKSCCAGFNTAVCIDSIITWIVMTAEKEVCMNKLS